MIRYTAKKYYKSPAVKYISLTLEGKILASSKVPEHSFIIGGGKMDEEEI